eukprot:59725_1
MGADCCKNRNSQLDLKVHDSASNTVTLRTAGNNSNKPTDKSPLKDKNDDKNQNDATQQLLTHKSSPNGYISNHNDYQSMNTIKSTLQSTDTGDTTTKTQCQTPPIIKALYGSDSQPNEIESLETPAHASHPITQHATTIYNRPHPPHKPNQNPHGTPMGFGGDVYLGFASNNQQITFQQEHRHSIHETDELGIEPPNIIRHTSAHSNSSNSSSSWSDTGDDWSPDKSLLMGFAEENDMVSFNPDPRDLDALFATKDLHNPCTLSTMSLNSAHLADMVITGVGASSSFSSLKSFPTPNYMKLQMPWIITSFNLLIEYFPYKHIMQDIFACCAVDITAFDFIFPSTVELENKYNYYDTPYLFIENVSSSNKHQPCLVLMIGPPGSGKTSYANYRYGKQCVVAADDYFDVHYSGQFVGADVKEAHRYCQEQVLARLYKNETVVVANTHSNYWQLYDKIIPVIFDNTLPHKIVFAVMPETNATTLVRRCVHVVTKPKIMEYTQSIRYMLRDGGVISTDKVLKYGRQKIDMNGQSLYMKSNQFEYGLWIDADGYRSVQDWYQHKTNTNLMRDVGDGRISPIIECTWPVFKKSFKKWLVLSKFTSENDPVIDLEVRIIGFVKNRIIQMVAVEIIQPPSLYKHRHNKHTMESTLWHMFKRQINMESMGCVLAMRQGIPFSTAKYAFDYNCIEYVSDGPIVKAKLATKRYVRNYIKYYTPPPPIHCDTKAQASSNNLFFNLEGVSSSREILPPDPPAVIDKSSFALKLREKHVQSNGHNLSNTNGTKQNENVNDISLNPDAQEFKMEEKEKERLNPSAMEFQPKPQAPMPFVNFNMNVLPPTQPWLPPSLLQNNMNFVLQTQHTQPLLQSLNVQNNAWNGTGIMDPPQQVLIPPSAVSPVKVMQQNNNSFEGIDYSGMAAYANVKQNVFVPSMNVNAVSFVPNNNNTLISHNKDDNDDIIINNANNATFNRV